MDHARGGTEPKRTIGLNELVEENFQLAVDERHARDPDFAFTVERHLAEDAGSVVAAAQELGRVVVNLASNALDALQERANREEGPYSPHLVVRTRREGNRVFVSVTDNGVGISEAVRTRMFEPFFTTKPTGRGNIGLGLSLSRDLIVKGYGGSLDVDSEVGVGTTFTIALPDGSG
jgi:signal transduction histidine kinase